MAEKWKAFSAADTLALAADPSWEAAKELGNQALHSGEHLHAAKLYRQAALLALGPLEGGGIHAFIVALESWPEGSAHRQLAEAEDLLWHCIISLLPMPPLQREKTLPSGVKMTARYPNKGVAISWANRAQALLLAGNPKKALRSAQRAIDANPEYLKAHHRKMKALEVLGDAPAAGEIRKQLEQYRLARSMYPAEALAMYSVGWIDWERAKLVYGPVRFRAAAEAVVAALPEGQRRVEVRASIVPYEGGQGLVLTLAYGPTDLGPMNSQGIVECMDFELVDHENGKIADRPPNGHASPRALVWAPRCIGKFIEEVGAYELSVVAVMLGQGLVEHVDHIEEKLKEGYEGLHGPKQGLVVYPAVSTGASEDSFIAPNMMSTQELRAKLAMMGFMP